MSDGTAWTDNGLESAYGKISTLSGGAVSSEPFLIFNPNPWVRDELAVVKVWDKEIPGDHVKVTVGDGVTTARTSGEEFPGQVVERGNYWGHRFMSVAFPVEKIPPMGYRVYAVTRSYSPVPPKPTNWWLVGSIYLADIVLLITILWLIKHRRQKGEE